MNQILETKKKNKNLIRLFKLQFIISFAALIILFMYISKENKLKAKENEITNVININAKINTIFKSENYETKDSKNEMYLCNLKIEKINLEYFVYNSYTEELLKILPCKFYGQTLRDSKNICIIGHNYFDNRFFSNLNKLELNDEIILEDLHGKVYKFYVYDMYEIYENDINEIIRSESDKKTIILCTCTFNKNKRFIVKAQEKQV